MQLLASFPGHSQIFSCSHDFLHWEWPGNKDDTLPHSYHSDIYVLLHSIQDDQVTHTNFVFVCLSDGAVVWVALSYVYKALLQLLAMFMAFSTRLVKIKALNDSKEIAVVIYFNSITLTLLAVVEFSLKQHHEVYAALFSLALLVEASVFLTLIFIPKVYWFALIVCISYYNCRFTVSGQLLHHIQSKQNCMLYVL